MVDRGLLLYTCKFFQVLILFRKLLFVLLRFIGFLNVVLWAAGEFDLQNSSLQFGMLHIKHVQPIKITFIILMEISFVTVQF